MYVGEIGIGNLNNVDLKWKRKNFNTKDTNGECDCTKSKHSVLLSMSLIWVPEHKQWAVSSRLFQYLHIFRISCTPLYCRYKYTHNLSFLAGAFGDRIQ